MDQSKEIPHNSNRVEGVKKLIGIELTGSPEKFPDSFTLPNDLLGLARSYVDNSPLQEKMALIDYASDISTFVPRKVFQGETYDPKKKSVNSTSIWGTFLAMQSRALKGEPVIEMHNHPDIISIGDGYKRKGIRLPDAFTKLAFKMPSTADLNVYLAISHGFLDIIVTKYGGSIVVPWNYNVKSRRPFGIVNFSESFLEKSIEDKTAPVLHEGIARFGRNKEQLEYFVNSTLKKVTYSAYAKLLERFECSIYFSDDISKPFQLAK